MILWAIGLGGAAGALLRHFVNQAIHARFGDSFPFGIFAVNVLGCLAIGVVAGLIASERVAIGPAGRAFVIVGLLGGFTTFSSFGLDTFTLARGGQIGAAMVNAFGQLCLGMAAVWTGYALAQIRL